MIKTLIAATVIACHLCAPALADGLANMKKGGCQEHCHAMDKPLVGPSWKSVAAKYKGDKGAEARLIKKVNEGGAGAWSAMPMPPQKGKMTDAELKEAVSWMLGL